MNEKTERTRAYLYFTYLFFCVALALMVAGRPPMHAQTQIPTSLDDVQSEKIARVNDHLASTDRMVEDNRAQTKALQTEVRDLEAQMNQWKGAEDVWLKIISLLAGGGIVLQIAGKVGGTRFESRKPVEQAAKKERA